MNEYWFAITYNVALMATICFLCWTLQSGWPCCLLLFALYELSGPDSEPKES